MATRMRWRPAPSRPAERSARLTPPSGALIVFGILAEQSIGKLFTAAIVPAITQTLFYLLTIVMVCRWRPSMGPAMPRASWSERAQGTAARGGSRRTDRARAGRNRHRMVHADGSGIRGRRRRGCTVRVASPAHVGRAPRCACRTRCERPGMLYVVIIGALIFSVFMSLTGLSEQIAAIMDSLSGGRITAVVTMALILLLLGSVLDGLALMLLTTPILLPIILKLGLSPIWFGIFLVRTMEIGFIHPPIGINLYVIQGIAKDVPLSRIFKGCCHSLPRTSSTSPC